MAFRAAKCPECLADIQVPDRDIIKCMYCGKDIVVRTAVQAAVGPSVANWLKLADAAAEAGNHDEAYNYFTRVLEVEPENYRAWLGKGLAAGWDARLNGNRFSELSAGIERALSYAPEAEKEAVAQRAADEINTLTNAYFVLSIDHTYEYISLDSTWDEHVDRCIPILTTLMFASTLDPKNKDIVESGIFVAQKMIEGVRYSDQYDTDGNGFERMKTKHLPEPLEARVKAIMGDFVAKMKALDTTYEAPEIKKAGEATAGGRLGALVILVALGFGALWLLKALFS